VQFPPPTLARAGPTAAAAVASALARAGRGPQGLAGEAPCKVLCHNLCVVIQEQCELGIEAHFWKDEPRDEGADVLPLVVSFRQACMNHPG
jgi:hypothetical protein